MKNIFTLIALTAIFIAQGVSLSAQPGFIELHSRDSFLEECTRLELFYSIEDDIHHLAVAPIKVRNLWDYQHMGELTFSLPGVEQPIRAVVNMPKRYSDTDYVWTGDVLDGEDQAIGYVSFVQKGEKKFGSIELDGRSFIIRDLNMLHENDQVLIEIDNELTNKSCGTDDLPEDDAGGPTPIPGGPEPTIPPEGGGGCDAVITILILYTQEVIGQGYDPEQLASLGVADLNTALSESNIPDINVSTEVVGTELLDGYAEVSNGDEAVARLADNENISRLRDEYNADLVILFQNMDLFAFRLENDILVIKDLAGIAIGINDIPDINMVFSVIETRASSKIFAHEVGHLLGCRHLKEDDPHEYANANKFCIAPFVVNGEIHCNGYKSTIMDGRADASRVLRFSNPEGNYMSYVTGTEDHNNARMIARTACPVSLFGGQVEGEFEDPPFSAFASGPTNVYSDNEASFEYSSYYQGCTDGIVSYHWEVSWDYGNTYQHLSFEEGAVLDGEDIPSNMPVGYIRLTADCSEEPSQYVDFLEVKNWSAQNSVINTNNGEENLFLTLAGRKLFDEAQNASLSDSNEFIAYPNPAGDVLHVITKSLSGSPTNIELISVQGIKYNLFKGIFTEFDIPSSFDISNIPSGFYVLYVQSSEACFHSPIIITRK